jgi:hypothetical protein
VPICLFLKGNFNRIVLFLHKTKFMIEFKFNTPEETKPFPNQPNELLLKDFEELFNVINDKSMGGSERMLLAFKKLGVTEDDIDLMTKDQFINNSIQLKKSEYNDELPPAEIEVKGRKYVANIGEDLVISARDVVAIERLAKHSAGRFPSSVMAVIYKDSELTKTEHYADAHIKHKSSLFRDEFPAKYAIPLLVRVARETVKDLTTVEMA